MFHSLTRSLRKPILWLMLPLAVLAGRPTAGCVCLDGTVKTTCCKSNWLIGSLCDSHVASKHCCSHGGSGHCGDCCHAAQGDSAGGPNYSATGGCQCQTLANSAESAKITKWSANPGESHLLVPLAESFVLPLVVDYHAASVPAEVLPPPDRVVLFLHLTI